MVRFADGPNPASACKFIISGSTTEYPILFNGISTDATTSPWRKNGVFPFYYDGTVFNQLCYASIWDRDTLCTGHFGQPLGMNCRIKINGDRDIVPFQIMLERADGTFDSTLTSPVSQNNTKAVNTNTDFKVDGMILFNKSNYNFSANAVETGNYFWVQTNDAPIVNYAFNGVDHLRKYSWVFLVGIPQADPMVYRLDPTSLTSWYTTEKPTTDDGKVYIRLGFFSEYSYLNLFAQHPAYWFRSGYFRPYLTT